MWRLKLNETKNFFDVIISHVLVQINPDRFKFQINSYADIITFLNKQADLLIQYGMNEILGLARYSVASIAEGILNAPFFSSTSYLALD